MNTTYTKGANGWEGTTAIDLGMTKPDDMGRRGDLKLLLEIKTQKSFSGGIVCNAIVYAIGDHFRTHSFGLGVHGDFVKLTLAPDDCAYWTRFEWTDEGSNRTSMWWTHKGYCVERETVSRGRDCDGVLERQDVQACTLDDLTYYPETDADPGPPLPRWRDVRGSQYDAYAEAMGY